MSPETVPLVDRRDRRRERTRAALIAAAQQIICEGNDSHTTIQAITDLADVGFGSFYNHFATKEELFDVALMAAVNDYATWLDERLVGVTDPAMRLFESIRFTGLLALEQPTTAQLLVRRLGMLGTNDLLAQRMATDVSAAMAGANTTSSDIELATLVAATLGAIQAVLARTLTLSAEDLSQSAEVLAHAVLRLLSLETRPPAT